MDEPIRILLCEDEANLGNILRELLESKNFEVDLCKDGEAGWEAFQANHYDLCLLDIMMPKKDGLTLARDIREMSTTIPIIFLTALGMRENILEGFHSGADDYITKPFSMEELLLRIEAILRRTIQITQKEIPRFYRIGRYTFNTHQQTLTSDEEGTRRLTTKESDLLVLLCQFANQTLERSHALSVVWGINNAPANDEHNFSQRSIDVYITKLRRMLAGDPEVEIKNVHGKGYKLVIPFH